MGVLCSIYCQRCESSPRAPTYGYPIASSTYSDRGFFTASEADDIARVFFLSGTRSTSGTGSTRPGEKTNLENSPSRDRTHARLCVCMYVRLKVWNQCNFERRHVAKSCTAFLKDLSVRAALLCAIAATPAAQLSTRDTRACHNWSYRRAIQFEQQAFFKPSISCNGSRDRYYNSLVILGDARPRADRRLAQYSVRQFAPTAAASWFNLGSNLTGRVCRNNK
ncbi:unnamed protein product [Trichogramma brassicae]|uniref:Uncharacterized protein n=1 Tax=Trichogramma brassicae TaxID=86971 RepID=A0A6H5I624_9HYME|nr:unnamed protein product [Trichogramma brassicae]